MKLIKSKKGISFLLVIAIAAISAVGALAYWTTSGSGSGTAAVGTDADNLVVTGTADAEALTPAGPGSVISFTAANPSDFNQRISNIHLESIAPDAGHSACATVLGTDFSMADVPVTSVDGDIVGGQTAQVLAANGTLYLLDSLANQDACKGASLTLTFSTT
jgi:hypothetical protein